LFYEAWVPKGFVHHRTGDFVVKNYSRREIVVQMREMMNIHDAPSKICIISGIERIFRTTFSCSLYMLQGFVSCRCLPTCNNTFDTKPI
jgi:hypothetical protein